MRIFLTGFMGSGKSYWGKLWASIYDLSFYDLDEVIERAEQKSVLDIFEKDGEEYFRKKESVALRTMISYDHCIIACGGGTACFDKNILWMNDNGLTVYLAASPQFLLDKIMEEKDKRPLLKKVNQAELLFFIEQKLSERMEFYKQADLTISAEKLDERSFKKVLSAAKKK